MKIETSQGPVVIEHDDSVKHIVLKLSGGADSAILCYLLHKYIIEEAKQPITIVPMTVIHGKKPTNLMYARRVYWWMKKHFDNDLFHWEHYTAHSNGADYSDVSEQLEHSIRQQGLCDVYYSGITANPPRDVWTKFKGLGDGSTDVDISIPGGLPDTRDKTDTPKQTHHPHKVLPFLNIDKKGIAELYRMFDVEDTLFPITRTCEDHFRDPEEVPHCGECVWCEERAWGFGKL